MKTTLCILSAALAFGSAFARPPAKERPKYSPEEIQRIRAEQHEKMLAINGGTLTKPGSAKGRLAFFNGQRRIPEGKAAGGFRYLAKTLKLDFEVRTFDGKAGLSNAAAICKEAGANAAVFLVDDESMTSTFVVSPEEHWAIVNVAALDRDKAGDAFLVARTHKEVIRALLHAMNAADSQHPDSLMGPIEKLKDLDDLASPRPPADVIGRVVKALPQMGLSRWKTSTYREACQEGWAPQPTNDYQRAIWDKVHQIPDKPITIEYDPKKDK